MTIHGWVATVAETSRTRANTSCRALVERAENRRSPVWTIGIFECCGCLEQGAPSSLPTAS
jgi:hypothetical protein